MVVLLAAVTGAARAQDVQARTVGIGSAACAGGSGGWPAPASGRTIFSVRNTESRNFFLVQLVAGDSATSDPRYGLLLGKVYGQIGMLAPRTTVELDVVLPPGRYFFRCLDRNGISSTSQIEPVKGKPVPGARPYAPLDLSQLPLALLRYRAAIAPVLRRLRADTDRLTRAVRAGRLGAARTSWLPAHLDYAQLGVAYGTFGSLDGQINGRPTGLQLGVRDPQFQGFLRLEYGLWHGQSRAQLLPVVTALDRAVRSLVARASSPKSIWVASDLPLRAHEILENALQFELTGRTDEGSGTNLATAWANARGTMLALDALRPLLQHGRDPELISNAIAQTSRLTAALGAHRRPSGSWEPLASLSLREHEQLDSATSSLLETLELVPGELQNWSSKPSSTD